MRFVSDPRQQRQCTQRERSPVDRVVAAENDLLDAELQLASSKQERVKLCQKRIENLRFLEKILTQRFAQGGSSMEDRLVATAARLQAEIDCLRQQLPYE